MSRTRSLSKLIGPSGSQAFDTNTLVIDAANNRVGIGTISPDQSLDVTRSGDGDIAVFQTTATHGVVLSAPSSTTLQIASVQGSKNLDLWANTLSFSAGGSERIRIHSEGYTELKSSDSYNQLVLTPSGTNAPASINFNTPGTGRAQIKVQNNEYLSILSTGNVGIGTTAPSEQLHIFNNSQSWDAYARIRLGTESSSYEGSLGYHRGTTDDADRGLYLSGSGTTKHVNVRYNGSVGIGNNIPDYKLDVGGTTEIQGRFKSSGGTGWTQGAIVLESNDSLNNPGNRGQGVYMYNVPNQRTWYSGTLYNNGNKFGIGYQAAAGLQHIAADNVKAKLVIDGDTGSVGIGTGSPLVPLHIVGASNETEALRVSSGASGTGCKITFRTPDNGDLSKYIMQNAYWTEIGVHSNEGLRMRNESNAIKFSVSGSAGNCSISGSLSKGSGSFKIDHPLPEKNATHNLVHSFIEGPQADNLYRGKVDLIGGLATVNIDTVVGMTEGTFAALNREVQCFTTNESGWTAIKGSVIGNILTIVAQADDCTDTISWMVIGERKDAHMLSEETDWTDSDGKVIIEPLKVSEEDQLAKSIAYHTSAGIE